MRKPLYRQLPNLGRTLLLLFSCAAGCTALVWTCWPELVHELDTSIVKLYEHGSTEAWNEAREVVVVDRARGIERLADLLEDLEDIQKSDRLGGIKRAALDLLTASLEAEGDFARAAGWAERWTGFDERDLNARIRLAELLSRTAGREEEGIGLLAEVQRRIPEVEAINESYVGMLIAAGRGAEACQVLLDALRAGVDPLSLPTRVEEGWMVFVDSGDGFGPGNREVVRGRLGEDGSFEIPLRIPSRTRRIRIDPPPHSSFRMTRAHLELDLGGERVTAGLGDLSVRLEQIDGDPGAMECTADKQDPRLVMNLEGLISGDAARMTLRARIADEPEPRAGGSTWNLYWDEGRGFRPELREKIEVGVTGGFLELSFGLPQGARKLRIDPPPGSCFRLEAPTLEYRLAGQTVSLNLCELPIRLHEMELVRGALQVSASARDPYISWFNRGDCRPGISARFRAELSLASPKWVRDVLSRPEMSDIERGLAASGDHATLARLDALRARVMREEVIR